MKKTLITLIVFTLFTIPAFSQAWRSAAAQRHKYWEKQKPIKKKAVKKKIIKKSADSTKLDSVKTLHLHVFKTDSQKYCWCNWFIQQVSASVIV